MNNENKKCYYRALGSLREQLARMKRDIDTIDRALRNENLDFAKYLIKDWLYNDYKVVDIRLDTLLIENSILELGDK